MQTILMQFDQGVARCLWSDAIPLAELGTLEVTRASRVEFNADAQQWEVRLASEPGRVAFRHANRATCLKWEVAELEARMMQSR